MKTTRTKAITFVSAGWLFSLTGGSAFAISPDALVTGATLSPLSYVSATELEQPEESGGELDLGDGDLVFGRAGYDSMTFKVSGGASSRSDTWVNGSWSYNTFIVDELELSLELAAWGLFQSDGNDAIAPSLSLLFRWHFLIEEEQQDWSTFIEFGAGIMFASDEVPDGGSEFNFMPRAGFGATFRLDDYGTRLVTGAHWQHFSNASVFGRDRNPGRDGIMGYVGISIPF